MKRREKYFLKFNLLFRINNYFILKIYNFQFLIIYSYCKKQTNKIFESESKSTSVSEV
jgi:hypothetical protein